MHPSRAGCRTREFSFLAALVLGSIVVLQVYGIRVRKQRAERSAAEPAALEPMPADKPAGPLNASAIAGKNQLAGELSLPRLPSGIRGVVNPDEEKKEKRFRYDPSLIPPPVDYKGIPIRPSRFQRIYEAGDSGWGYLSPDGFTQDPETEGLWISENAVILVANAHTSKECVPACGGKTLGVEQTKRSTASGYRTYTFQCDQSISLGGASWPLYESTLLQIDEAACVITTLAARSAAAQRQVREGYFNMYRRLAPLPPLPEKPLIDAKGRSRKVRPLR
jgi:hypothetical protein